MCWMNCLKKLVLIEYLDLTLNMISKGINLGVVYIFKNWIQAYMMNLLLIDVLLLNWIFWFCSKHDFSGG